MKYLFFLLLIPSFIQAQSKAYNPDSTVWVETNDKRIILSYIKQFGYDQELSSHGPRLEKYDTIGGWHLVSDTARDHWNPTYAVYLYEVRAYEDQIINITGAPHQFSIPVHFKWLDKNKKPITLKVWY